MNGFIKYLYITFTIYYAFNYIIITLPYLLWRNYYKFTMFIQLTSSTLLIFFCFVFLSQSSYQMWKQCDPKWAHIPLGFSNSDTICSAGCLMTSVTMAVTSLPTWADPAGMNQWLK